MSDHTDMMLNRAIASADFDAYREDAKDDRIAALEAENAALKAELEIARHTHSESWKYVVSRAEKSEAQVDALTAELNAKSEQLTALSGHLEAMINANQRVRAEREEASACAEALQSELEWVSRKALRLYRRAWDVHHLLLHPDDAAAQIQPEWPAALRVFRLLLMGLDDRINPDDEALLVKDQMRPPDWIRVNTDTTAEAAETLERR